ncbi:uncharacterized protein LY89DRAFT_499413 [Mollisia scopiformis]|uniref:Uncharacterized protein n=1 Tax=Mollisia scopiformis TaxID=149040 RepID=A0A194XEK1_MOLSC|nr:uncharacterized protein LY89DRAFT_499413 [Mollisia scopiformis]KUJ18574.1 hypothetical protein LY89DRAFT_499413 [Mollisia scopiformis]
MIIDSISELEIFMRPVCFVLLLLPSIYASMTNLLPGLERLSLSRSNVRIGFIVTQSKQECFLKHCSLSQSCLLTLKTTYIFSDHIFLPLMTSYIRIYHDILVLPLAPQSFKTHQTSSFHGNVNI